MVNISEVRMIQLASSTLLVSTLMPLDLFISFKICSDSKERMVCVKQREATHLFNPGKTAALVPEFTVEDLSSPRFLLLQ